MKNLLLTLLIVGLIGCSDKSHQINNIQEPVKKQETQDTDKLAATDVTIVPDPSNPFNMDIKTGLKVLNFEIKNLAAVNGALKINLNFKNELSINNIGSSCGTNGFTRVNANSSCFFSIFVNSDILNAGVLTYDFSIQDSKNGIITAYQNFISVLDPLGNGNTSFPGSNGICKINYHLEERSCKFNVKACVTLPEFALTGTQTWNGSGYEACQITQCEQGYNLLNNSCSITSSSNQYELVSINGNAATANHTVSFKSSHKYNYTFANVGIGVNFIDRVQSDRNNDGVLDGPISGLENLIGVGNISCGKNNISGFVECYLTTGRTVALASKLVLYDNIGDGSGSAQLPVSLVDKLFTQGESIIAGTPYTYVLMKDKTLYAFYSQGATALQKAIKVKYSLLADSTIDGDLIADNNTDVISYLSSSSNTSTTNYACAKSQNKIMCWYAQGNSTIQMALPVQIDTNADGTGDTDLDASLVEKLIPTTGYTGVAKMLNGQIYSWTTNGRGTLAAKPVVLYNTTTPLVLPNVVEMNSSFNRMCALTTDKLYCWLGQGQGTSGATIVKADLNNDNILDGDLDASLIDRIIPSHSPSYTYLLLKSGRVVSFINDGQSAAQSAKYILDASNGLPLENMSFPFSAGKTNVCGIYNKKNIYCFYGQSQVQGGKPVLYDSDADSSGDTPFDIDDNNPLQRRITITKTASQGSVDVKDLTTNNILGTCALASTSCTVLVPDLANVAIESTPSEGYNFVNYTDAKCLGTNSLCNLTAINSNLTITPIFSASNYTVTVNVLPSNLESEATLVIRRASVACSGACLSTYNKGTLLNVIATPSKYVNNATFEVIGTGITNINTATANQLSLNVGTSDVIVNITLTDKALTVPTFSFNGTLSGSLITIPNNPLTVTTSNVTMAREILISESADCSTGTYVAYASPINYTYSQQLGTNPVSFMFKNNSQVSACYPYTIKMTNISRLCNPQPANSVAASGNQVSTDGGTTWGNCTGFTCNTAFHVSGTTCAEDVISCSISGGTGVGTQTWNGTAYGSCVLSSCNNGYHQNGNTCESNIQSCTLENGSGYKTWNGTAYGSCYANSCIGSYVPYNGTCVIPLTRACSPQPSNSIGGTQISYNNGVSYEACTGYTCSSALYNDYSDGLGCVLINQTRACTSRPANSTGGLEYSYDGAHTWGSCQDYSCASGFVSNGSACVVLQAEIVKSQTTDGTGSYRFGAIVNNNLFVLSDNMGEYIQRYNGNTGVWTTLPSNHWLYNTSLSNGYTNNRLTALPNGKLYYEGNNFVKKYPTQQFDYSSNIVYQSFEYDLNTNVSTPMGSTYRYFQTIGNSYYAAEYSATQPSGGSSSLTRKWVLPTTDSPLNYTSVVSNYVIPGTSPARTVLFNGNVYAIVGGYLSKMTDGGTTASSGYSQVSAASSLTVVRDLIVVNNVLYFSAVSSNVRKVYKYDGTTVTKISNYNGNSYDDLRTSDASAVENSGFLYSYNNKLVINAYFASNFTNVGDGVYLYDGTTLSKIPGSETVSSTFTFVAGNKLLFTKSDGLYYYDGNGINKLVFPSGLAPSSYTASKFFVFQGKLHYENSVMNSSNNYTISIVKLSNFAL